ncbi:ABC transporter substrate-binding protein [Geobacter pelophilus]|uniref:ABC transporter substrate-binding protein n=2 Tax=Geoanaerobacter pelophilus TaxID=60036 RepID=A0AAW4L0N4_9BACT|nr:ABC transporter substrate-binding protein [Geoanaerobacter pelophilus]
MLIVTIASGLVAGQVIATDSSLQNKEKSAPDLETRQMVTVYPGHNDAEGQEQTPSPEMLRLGARMYREGILPSGEPMKASNKEEIQSNSTAFSCVSCHMRGGLGSIEGGITTPPAAGIKLFQPAYTGTILSPSSKRPRKHFVINPTRRPAYTEESLAVALRDGLNPTGRKLDDVMPRYNLQDKDMAILISYLKSLSANVSPGVDETTLRLGTIIADDVSPETRKAILDPLDNFIAARNNQDKVYEARTKYMRNGGFFEEGNLAYRKLSLARWELKGPPATWRNQLEEWNRKEPVFAFIGGITTGEWQPIHDFCEAHQIPCLFPFTDFPVISATDWYTMYFSKGLYQEGEAAARFLDSAKGSSHESRVVQVVSNSREGQVLAAGFTETWLELGNPPPVTIPLQNNETVSSDALQQLLAGHNPSAILFWTGPEILPGLQAMAQKPQTPQMLVVSSGYLKSALWSLPDQARAITFITYPYRLPDKPSADSDSLPIAALKAKAITEVLQLGLSMMNRNFYRDTFFDVISMIQDQTPQAYERLNFAPGQRYASKECNIVQLTQGKNPVLVKKNVGISF